MLRLVRSQIVLLFLTAGAFVQTTHAEVLCAVLPAGQGESEATAAALVEQELGSIAGIKLVERAALKAVLDEQLLAAALSPKGIGQRVRLGKLLKADLLVILREVNPDKQPNPDGEKSRNPGANPAAPTAKTPAAPPRSPQAGGTKSTQASDATKNAGSLEAVVISTGRGIRLSRDAFPLETDKLPATARGIADLVQKSLAIDRSPNLLLFGVPGFEHLDTVPERVDHRAAYAGLIEQYLARLPGAVVVELAEAKALGQEAAVSGSGIERTMPYYVIGSFSTAGGPDRVSLRLELQHGQQTIASVGPQDAAPVQCAAALERMLGQLVAKLDDRKLPSAGPKQEAELIVRRANLFRRIGEMDQALPLYESALLLDSDNLHARLGIFEGCSSLMIWGGRRAVRGAWPIDYDGRLRYWAEGLEQLEWFLRQDPLDPQGLTQVYYFRRYCHIEEPQSPERARFLPEYKTLCRRQADLLVQLLESPKCSKLKQWQLEATTWLLAITCSDFVDMSESQVACGLVERHVRALGGEPERFEWQVYSLSRLAWAKTLDGNAYSALLQRLQAASVDQIQLAARVSRVLASIKDKTSCNMAVPELERLTAGATYGRHRPLCLKTAQERLRTLESSIRPEGGKLSASLTTQPGRTGTVSAAQAKAPAIMLARFVPLDLHTHERVPRQSPLIEDWICCGDIEVLCTIAGVFRLQDGIWLEQLDPERAKQGCWDGRYCWTIGLDSRPRVIDPLRGRVAQIDERLDPEGLTARGRLLPIEPGKVCLVGGADVGPEQFRHWAVLLEARQEGSAVQCRMETLFKVRNVIDPLDSKAAADPLNGLSENWAVVTPTRAGRTPSLVIGRGNADRPLCLDLASKTFRTLPNSWPQIPAIVSIDQSLYIGSCSSGGVTSPAAIYRLSDLDHALEKWLDFGDRTWRVGSPLGTHAENMLVAGGMLHILRDQLSVTANALPAWTAIDLKTRQTYVLMDQWPQGMPRGQFAVSRRYGLVFRWNSVLYEVKLPSVSTWPLLETSAGVMKISSAPSVGVPVHTDAERLHDALMRLFPTRAGATLEPWSVLRHSGFLFALQQQPAAFDAFASELQKCEDPNLRVSASVLRQARSGTAISSASLDRLNAALKKCTPENREQAWLYQAVISLAEFQSKHRVVPATTMPARAVSSRPFPVGNTVARARADMKQPASAPAPAASAPASRPAGEGAVVLMLEHNALAASLGIKPGDVIVSFGGKRLPNAFALDLWTQQKGQSRDVVFRSGGQERTVQLPAGWRLGVYAADYDEVSGPALVTAARALADRDFKTAAEQFGKVYGGGPRPGETSYAAAIYACCLYYCGEIAGAKRQLDALAPRLLNKWNDVTGFFYYNSFSDHLLLYATQRAMQDRPQSAAPSYRADRLSRLARYPEALILTAAETRTRSASGSEFEAAITASEALGFPEEAIRTVERFSEVPRLAAYGGPAVCFADKRGRTELAAQMAGGVFADVWSSDLRPFWGSETLRLYLKAGGVGKAKEFLARLSDDEQLAVLLQMPLGFYWADAQDLWLGVARAAATNPRVSPAMARIAFDLLLMQATPDAAQLEGLMKIGGREDRYLDAAQLKQWRAHAEAALAMLRRDFAKAVETLKTLGGQGARPHELEAAGFLRDHASSMTGKAARWRRTGWAWRRANGWLLLTCDWHIGLADASGGAIREIPLPQRAWRVRDFERAFTVSSSGKTVITFSERSIYRLNAAESGWDKIAERPWDLRVNAGYIDPAQIEPGLDLFVAQLQKDGKQGEIVWPGSLWSDNRMCELMLSDGRWLVLDKESDKVYMPREALERRFGPNEIYYIAWNPSAYERMYLVTSSGIYKWNPFDGSFAPVPLPGITTPTPVTTVADYYMVPKGHLRIGLFPDQGGTTFLLNLETGEIRKEGLINEGYPETYWLQKPVPWRQEQARAAFKKAGQPWPF